ncbi:MAG: mechanosensitive ion channel family protein [Planctomycetes bacterium]|nr:mechanosensitive ion channel family protein [Planctomycetota bacterium]
METLTALWTTLGPWAPAAILLLLVALVVLFSRRLLSRATQGGFHHQVVMAGLPLLTAPALVLLLPIGDATRGQLLSLIGILFSAAIALSSTTFVGNAMAGLLLRGIGNFKPGDFLAVKEEFGRVVSRGLFHTELQTVDRDLVTLPNLFLVTNPVKVVRASGTMIAADVSLGYDVPRTEVEAQLLLAAERAGLREAFVSVVELQDFSVLYRVSGLLEDTLKLISTRSALRKSMLDALHGAGIEILSPNYQAIRTLSERRAVLPEQQIAPQAPAPATEPEKTPEAVIFDKAEEAATIERLRELHDQVGARLAETEGEEREALLARQAQLAALIEQRKEESSRD